MTVKWLVDPEDHDDAAWADYVSLISEADVVTSMVDAVPCRPVSWQS